MAPLFRKEPARERREPVVDGPHSLWDHLDEQYKETLREKSKKKKRNLILGIVLAIVSYWYLYNSTARDITVTIIEYRPIIRADDYISPWVGFPLWFGYRTDKGLFVNIPDFLAGKWCRFMGSRVRLEIGKTYRIRVVGWWVPTILEVEGKSPICGFGDHMRELEELKNRKRDASR